LPLPLSLNAAFGEKHEVLDRRADWPAQASREEAGHRLTSGDALERVTDQRRDVVRQDDPALTRCPFKDSGVVSGLVPP
jgi:hypothetical protein